MTKKTVYLNSFARKGGIRLQFLRQSAFQTHHCWRRISSITSSADATLLYNVCNPPSWSTWLGTWYLGLICGNRQHFNKKISECLYINFYYLYTYIRIFAEPLWVQHHDYNIGWFFDCMVFNAIFNSIKVVSRRPVHPHMLSWSSFNQCSAQYFVQATSCFPT